MKDKVEISVKKVLLISVMLVSVTAALVGIGTYAYFSASAVSGYNDFFTGSISFSVNGADPWTGNFNATVADIKPGMTGWGNLTIRNTGQNPADLWMNVTNISSFSTGTNSAKAAEVAATDIDSVIHFGVYNSTVISLPAAYVDPTQYTISTGAHGVKYNGAATKASRDQWIYLGNLQPATNVYVNTSYGMNYTVTNWAQLTNMTFTVDFYAQQSQGTPQPAVPSGEMAGHTR